MKRYMNKKMKASLTLEASFVITLIIIVIGIILSLWIYKFQSCWYTQAINECLLTGSNTAVLNEENYMSLIESKWESVKSENYLEPQDFSSQIEERKDEICISINGSTPLWGRSALKIDVEQKIEIVNPVKYIRRIAAIKEAVKE